VPRRGVRFPSGAELLGAITSHGPFYETPSLCQVVIEEFR
jgi:hypothetical protein